jgi:hypothetical protein
MKQSLFIVFFFLILASSSLAQKFNGGLLAGFTASQVDGDTYSGYNKAGFAAGAFVNRNINKTWSWQLELKLIQKGSHHVPDSLDPYDPVYRMHLNYAEVPIILNYHYKKKFIISAGIGIGYLFSFKEEKDYFRLYEDAYRYYIDYELSYNFGLSYKLTKKLVFGVGHSYSILPIRKHASGSVYKFNRGQYNNLISFTLFYQFNNE